MPAANPLLTQTDIDKPRRPVQLPTNVRRLDDRRPASNLVFDQYPECFLASPCFFRNVTTLVRKPLAYILVIYRLVECVANHVQNWTRCVIWGIAGKQGLDMVSWWTV